ncbi:hypothetical protein [Streptomyces chattanoogensis]|uniref:Uncharacterized protein n=1 Tax=Streptomyces chattanoogensis TaxID=66876 RepID=A0A0N1JWJ3_9ACTN|nr:hypothetical protein [Streptomyces chattanoogensis]KPC61253.1 hypothetical protein ADL29_25180 [Streptomyces chattanoogensis]
MSLILPENSGTSQPEPAGTRSRLSWVDLVLLVVVLGALIALLACGVKLPEAVTIVGIAGLVSAELRRRFTQT